MTGPRSRWDEQRAEKRRDSSAGMPTCSTCKKPSVLDPCRTCDIPTKDFGGDVTPELGGES